MLVDLIGCGPAHLARDHGRGTRVTDDYGRAAFLDRNLFATIQSKSTPSKNSASETSMMEKDSRDRTVLLVEDADDTRLFMRLALEHLGYIVFEAEDGEKALAVAERVVPDIILMDLSLPRMDGLTATQEIRANGRLDGVTIIAVTAHQGTDFREGAKDAGFNAYVTKPIDLDSLDDLMKGLLKT